MSRRGETVCPKYAILSVNDRRESEKRSVLSIRAKIVHSRHGESVPRPTKIVYSVEIIKPAAPV